MAHFQLFRAAREPSWSHLPWATPVALRRHFTVNEHAQLQQPPSGAARALNPHRVEGARAENPRPGAVHNDHDARAGRRLILNANREVAHGDLIVLDRRQLVNDQELGTGRSRNNQDL